MPALQGWTWNPNKKGSDITLSNNNLTLTKNSLGWNRGVVFGSQEFKGGDQYFQVRFDKGAYIMVGVAVPSAFTDNLTHGNSSSAFLYSSSGSVYGTLGTSPSGSAAFAANDTVGVHLVWNGTNSTYDLNYYKNGINQGTFVRNIRIPIVAAVEAYDQGATATLDSRAKKPN